MLRTRLTLTRLEERETPTGGLGEPMDPGTGAPPAGEVPQQSPPSDPNAPMDPGGTP